VSHVGVRSRDAPVSNLFARIALALTRHAPMPQFDPMAPLRQFTTKTAIWRHVAYNGQLMVRKLRQRID
jgi:hypothetical protein